MKRSTSFIQNFLFLLPFFLSSCLTQTKDSHLKDPEMGSEVVSSGTGKQSAEPSEEGDTEDELSTGLPSEIIDPGILVAENGVGYSGGDTDPYLTCFPLEGEFQQRLVVWSDGRKAAFARLYQTTVEEFQVTETLQNETLTISHTSFKAVVDLSAMLADSNRYIGHLFVAGKTEYLWCDFNPIRSFSIVPSGSDTTDSSSSTLRKFLKYRKPYWPMGRIPYLIHPSLENASLLIEAMAIYEKKTFVRFIPQTVESDYVVFRPTNSSMSSSFMGRKGSEQMVFIARGASLRNLLHELGHLFGLVHPFLRSGASRHVRLSVENALSQFAREITFRSSNDMKAIVGQRYARIWDFDSVMHLSPFAYSKNGLPTILPIDLSVSEMFEKTLQPILSDVDLKFMGDIYTASGCLGDSFQFALEERASFAKELHVVAVNEGPAIAQEKNESRFVSIALNSSKPTVLYLYSLKATLFDLKHISGVFPSMVVLAGAAELSAPFEGEVRKHNDARSVSTERPPMISKQLAMLRNYQAFSEQVLSYVSQWDPSITRVNALQACEGEALGFVTPIPTRNEIQ